MLVVFRNSGENTGKIRAVFRGDQPMCVSFTAETLTHMPPRRASSNRRRICKAGMPATDHVIQRRLPPKIRLLFGSVIHSSASFSPYRIFKALKIPTRYEIRVRTSASSTRSGCFFQL